MWGFKSPGGHKPLRRFLPVQTRKGFGFVTQLEEYPVLTRKVVGSRPTKPIFASAKRSKDCAGSSPAVPVSLTGNYENEEEPVSDSLQKINITNQVAQLVEQQPPQCLARDPR